ncbi:hypothetical protein MBLNU230_g1486t1 [Neophaeotheca triangularis]
MPPQTKLRPLVRPLSQLAFKPPPPTARCFTSSPRVFAEGDTGSPRSGGDAFTNREQASESYYIRQHEAEKVVEMLKGKAVPRESEDRAEGAEGTARVEVEWVEGPGSGRGVNKPHPRHHQHQPLFHLPFTSPPDPQAHPNTPDLDLRETETHYLIDVEVPGVKDTAELRLQWQNAGRLVLTGEVRRPGDESGEFGAELERQEGRFHGSGGEGKGKTGPEFLVAERRVGGFKRVFTFPVEVELEAGKGVVAIENIV